jgi:hypothetical protein
MWSFGCKRGERADRLRQELGGGKRRRADREAIARAAAARERCSAAVSRSRRLRSATGRNFAPGSVSITLRVVRSNRRKPSCVSSSRTSTLIPDCVMKSSSAAREKLWCRAVSTKAFNWRVVIFMANAYESMSDCCWC